METPLSPRSSNIPSKHPTISKADSSSKRTLTKEEAAQAKAAADRKAEKDKNHALPPPQYVVQPPGPDGALGEKYLTGKLLGKGGFAICYEGRLVGQKYGGKNPKFALKIVKARMGMKKMEEKFRTELQIHSKMRHPNIVEFHRAFTFLENTYVVLELCPNGSVMDMVRKRRCLSLPEVRRYAVQLCGAIKYMHARNVIHRDLKMGNLFLDQDMNIKIGDFGLAAILVTESEVKGAKRRTTLCGTPNYIAPEILEKKGKGHDHKVDIWAIGIILFAMITGYPPFASTSQDDIYRKVKSLEYVWPTEKCLNDIPEEAKSLVTSLLKSQAEDRPDPDYIVAHPFFSMHGCLAIPLALEPGTCVRRPEWLEEKSPRGDVMAASAERISIFALAKKCGVGHFPEADRAFPVVGDDIEKSIWKECVQEEADGRTPIVPLPDDTVYSSHSTSSTFIEESTPQSLEPLGNPDKSTISIRSVSDPSVRIIPRDSRSHAAQLRSEAGSRMAIPKTRVSRDVMASKSTHPRQHTTVSRASSRGKLLSTQGFLEELPLRPASALPEVRQARTLPKNFSRTTQSATTANDLHDSSSRESTVSRSTAFSSASSQNTITNRSVSDHCLVPDRERGERNTRTRRAVANVEQKLLETVASRNAANTGKESSEKGSSRSGYSIPDPPCMLIDSKEDAEGLGDTKPDDILRKLRALSTRLSREIDNAARVTESSDIIDDSKSDSVHARPVVVKWVDYTNKFGIGYILANGSIGCVFNGNQERASTCIMVPQAEEHLKRRKSPTYAERHQIVPRNGESIEFLENCGDRGMKRVSASPRAYRVNIGLNGMPGKLGSGVDSFDAEKRRTLILWDKFAKYMTQTLGKSDDIIPDAEPISHQPQPPPPRNSKTTSIPPPPFVRFYQRLGNVGIWGFGDGSFQFNFPDHTKLVVSADGLHIDFYHLSVSATQILQKGSLLPKSALDERSVLSGSLAVLLRGGKGGIWKDVLVANELMQKVRFVRDVVVMWVGGGGLGLGQYVERNGLEGKVKWEGLREVGGREKLVWVTVGARGGDGRLEVLGGSSSGSGSTGKEGKKG